MSKVHISNGKEVIKQNEDQVHSTVALHSTVPVIRTESRDVSKNHNANGKEATKHNEDQGATDSDFHHIIHENVLVPAVPTASSVHNNINVYIKSGQKQTERTTAGELASQIWNLPNQDYWTLLFHRH